MSLALVGFLSGYPGQRGPSVAGAGTQARSEFIILGTASGPNSEANRAQPANALLVGGQPYLIDAGDGAKKTRERLCQEICDQLAVHAEIEDATSDKKG